MRSRIIAVALAAAMLTGLTGTARAEDVGSSQEYIVGGTPASPGEFPFAVFLQIRIGSQNFVCGGSLVDPWYVLTAAHCVEEGGAIASPANVRATIGRTDLTNTTQGEVRSVAQVFVHPRYGLDAGDVDHDVAVLRLTAASTRPPIELASPYGPSDQAWWLPGTNATVIGWGRTCSGCFGSTTLRKVQVPVRTDREARDIYGSSFESSVHVAAGAPGVDSCNGDSGGPLFVPTSAGLKQFGVVSWGPPDCSGWPPGVYAEVGGREIHHWVRTIIRETPVVGDFNGDGRDDIATFTHDPNKDVWVALSTGSRFAVSSVWHGWMGHDGSLARTGDFDGDGRDDIWTFSRDRVWIAGSNGSSFGGVSHSRAIPAGGIPVVGDINGDRDDDLIVVRNHIAYAYYSSGGALHYLGSQAVSLGGVPAGAGTPLMADADGDTRDDLVVFLQGVGDSRAWVLRSYGGGFRAPEVWHDWFAIRGEMPSTGQFGGDRRQDVLTFTRDASRDVWVSLSNGSRFGSSSRWHFDFGQPPNALATGDFNGDGLDDMVNFTQDAAADAIVALNLGGRFGTPSVWHGWFAP